MTRSLLMAGVVGAVLLLDVAPADAQTCSSACNQIRRACQHVAKAQTKVAHTFCDDARDLCRADCEVGNQPCIDACALDPDPTTCLEGCVCAEVCNDNRVSCRDLAKDARATARAACDTARDACNNGGCTSVDGECMREVCKAPLRDCRNSASKAGISCKRACAKGTAKQACVRGCKRLENELLGLCSSQEAICIGGCMVGGS